MSKRLHRYILPFFFLAVLWGGGRHAEASQRMPGAETSKPALRESFASSLTLDGPAGTVLSFLLPEEVYTGLKREDLRDLCVFDAQGTPVPFVVRAPDGTSSSREIALDIPYFPWRPGASEVPAQSGAPAPAASEIEISTGGAIIRIKGQGAQELPSAGPIFLLLDMERFSRAVSESGKTEGTGASQTLREYLLRIQAEEGGAYVSVVTMQTSSDLARWRSVGGKQVLARMRQGEGDSLERNSLSLPSGMERYLLLRFDGDRIPLTGLKGEARFDSTAPLLRERIVPGSRSKDGRGVSYDLGGRFPLTSIGFDMPQAEIMAVRLSSAETPTMPQSARPAAPWFTQRGRGVIYRMEKEGVTITSAPFSVFGNDRYWRIEAQGDIPFAAPPGLRAYWLPQELVFLSRGVGPWTLAFGRAEAVEAANVPLRDFGAPQPAKQTAVSVVKGGAEQASPVAGLLTPSGGVSQWVLWGVLFLAVGLLSWLAIRLAKGMR